MQFQNKNKHFTYMWTYVVLHKLWADLQLWQSNIPPHTNLFALNQSALPQKTPYFNKKLTNWPLSLLRTLYIIYKKHPMPNCGTPHSTRIHQSIRSVFTHTNVHTHILYNSKQIKSNQFNAYSHTHTNTTIHSRF